MQRGEVPPFDLLAVVRSIENIFPAEFGYLTMERGGNNPVNCWTLVSSVTQHVQRRTCSNFHTRQDLCSKTLQWRFFSFSFLFCRRINLNTNRSMAIVKGMAWEIIKKKESQDCLSIDLGERFPFQSKSREQKQTTAILACRVCVSDTQ